MINNFTKNVKSNTNKLKNNYHKMKTIFLSFFKEKGKIKKIKSLLIMLWEFLKSDKVLRILLMALPFIVMDIATRLFGYKIDIYSIFRITPRLFSFAYILLFLGICLNVKSKYSKKIYSILFFSFFIFYLVQNIYYETMGNFFSFSIIALAHEGSYYFFDAIVNTNILIYLVAIILIVNYAFVMRLYPSNIKYNKKRIIKVSIIFIVLHIISKLFLGTANFELTWDTWKNPRNVYNNFNDSNKGMALTGIYEYTFRDFYVNYIRSTPKKSETENNFLSDTFSSNNDNFHKNKYTGKFKGKNVIFLQFEGIDDWLLTEEVMPNTYKLLNNSINFINHYSYNSGGGSTFNSEFMVNTGYITPYTFPMNAYTLNKNDYPYSMANLMKKNDYSIEAFHMNTKEYYSRGINYYNWGYDNYLGLVDIGEYTDKSYQLDRELVLNKTFYDELFKKAGKTISYIITYTNHMPFTTLHSACRQLLDIDYKDTIKDMKYSEVTDFYESLNMSEEDCIKRQARETDYMVGLLMEGLKDNGLYNNTVIFAYADHYLYTVSDSDILKNNGKDVDTNLINKTPFFIWSAGMKKEEIKKTNSQLDILPTFLNLMGISYNTKWYIGGDILDSSYKSMIVFPDLSWYDGNYYVVNDVVMNNKKIAKELLEEKNGYAEYLVKKNDLVLKYNYFKEISN